MIEMDHLKGKKIDLKDKTSMMDRVKNFFNRGKKSSQNSQNGQNEKTPKKDKPFLMLIVAGLAYFGFEEYKKEEIGKIQKVIDETVEKRKGLEGKLAELSQFEKLSKDVSLDEIRLTKKLEILQKISKLKEKPVVLFEGLGSWIPDEAWINTLSWQKNNLTVTGGASNLSGVTQFISAMEGSGNFFSVKLESTDSQKISGLRDHTQFKIALQMRENL